VEVNLHSLPICLRGLAQGPGRGMIASLPHFLTMQIPFHSFCSLVPFMSISLFRLLLFSKQAMKKVIGSTLGQQFV
jgi:hypothetical protein